VIWPGSTVIAAALLVTGCAADPAMRDAMARVGQVGPERLDGRVRLVGNYPFAHPIVVPVAGDAMRVSGPYEREIGRLAGVDVRVTGDVSRGTLPEPTLVATSYEVLSVDGEDAMVGTLVREGQGHVLRTQAGDVAISVVSDALAGFEGALVWIVLDENEGAARYGVLREVIR